jgi:hypothetical protein
MPADPAPDHATVAAHRLRAASPVVQALRGWICRFPESGWHDPCST